MSVEIRGGTAPPYKCVIEATVLLEDEGGAANRLIPRRLSAVYVCGI